MLVLPTRPARRSVAGCHRTRNWPGSQLELARSRRHSTRDFERTAVPGYVRCWALHEQAGRWCRSVLRPLATRPIGDGSRREGERSMNRLLKAIAAIFILVVILAA